MRAGVLRHRIDIESLQSTQTSDGIAQEAWLPWLENEPAEIVALSGREFIAAAAAQAGVTHRITVRERPGLLASMRIVHDGQLFNIRAILPDPTLRRHLTIMCESGVNDG